MTSTRTTSSCATGCEGTLQTRPGRRATARRPTRSRSSPSAYTDKGGPGGIVPLTGRAEAILQPKQKQAEFFASTGRVPDGTTGGTAGVQTETTADTEGGGQNIGFIEDGDYTSYKPFNLTDITEARFRVASAGPGGTIELRYDSPTGPLLGKTAMITPTGNWQTYKNVSLPLTGVRRGHARAVRHHPQPGPDGLAAEPQLDRLRRQGSGADRRARGDRVGEPADRRRAAAGGLHLHRDRPGRRHARLRVGLRRPRHDDGHVDAALAELHLRQPGQLHGHADRHRRPGRHHHEDVRDPRHRARGLRHQLPRRLRRRRPRRRLGRRAPRPGPRRLGRDAEDPDRAAATSTAATTTPRTSCCARLRRAR